MKSKLLFTGMKMPGNPDKRFRLGIVVVVTAIISRFLYAGVHPAITITPDSIGYYDIGVNMMHDPLLIINYWRTPLYPLFIQMIMILRGVFGVSMDSPEFTLGMQSILWIQGSIGVLGALIFYILLLRIGLPLMKSFILSLLHGMNMLIIPWERYLLTETLAIFFTIIFVYGLTLLMQHPTVKRFVLYLGISILLPLTKPILLPLPVFGLILVNMYRRNFRTFILSILVSLCVLSIPWGFSYYNSHRYGYDEFQSTSTINILGIILKYRLQSDALSSSQFFGPALLRWYERDGYPDPYHFINAHDASTYFTPSRLREIRLLNTEVFKDNMSVYISRTISDILFGMNETHTLSYNQNSSFIAYVLVKILQYLGTIILYIYITSIVLFLVLNPLKRKNLSKTDDTVSAMGMVVALQILFVALLSYGEYVRLVSSIVPFMFLYAGYTVLRYIDILKAIVRKRKARD